MIIIPYLSNILMLYCVKFTSFSCKFNVKRVRILILYLASFVIHVIIVLINQLWQRYKSVTLILQRCNESIKRLCCIFCSIMTKDYRTVTKMLMLCYCLDYGIHTIVFPVEGINIPLNRIVPAFLCFFHDGIIVIAIWRNYFAIKFVELQVKYRSSP